MPAGGPAFHRPAIRTMLGIPAAIPSRLLRPPSGRTMALRTLTLAVPPLVRFVIRLDDADRTQRDVLTHFAHGQMYEHETSMLFVRMLRPGDTVVDAGANAGYFSLLAAALVGPAGRVVAVEANPRLAALIRGTAALNAMAQIRVEAAALSDRTGPILFAGDGEGDSNGAVVPPGDPESPGPPRRTVPAETLDGLARRCGLERIALLKIDTEGHELNVLRGAEGLLAAGLVAAIVCEHHPPGLARFGGDPAALRARALRHGHHAFLPDPDGGLPRLVPPGTAIEQAHVGNILLSPIEPLAAHWPRVAHRPAAAVRRTRPTDP